MNGGEAQRNRLLEASMAGPSRQTTLAALIDEHASASAALSAILAEPSVRVSEDEYSRADNREFDAKQAVLTFLWANHGITRAMARKLGDIL